MSWNLLERFIESEHFNRDPSLTVAYLARYADHVGIHYVLCSKLRQFSYEEIDFFLPQLCHLVISIDNDSMALEEFVIDLCEESVNGALLTFWLFQTYLRDLTPNPSSNAFRTCRRVYNKVQRIVFGVSEPVRKEKIKENILPVTVLSSIVLASIAAPFLPAHVGPLAIAQARKPRPVEETISENVQTQKLGRSHTVSGGTTRARRPRPSPSTPGDAPKRMTRTVSRTTIDESSAVESPASYSPTPRRVASGQHLPSHRQSLLVTRNHEGYTSTASLPDIRSSPDFLPGAPSPPKLSRRPTEIPTSPRRHSHTAKPLSVTSLTPSQRTRILRSNYFRNQTQFLTALEDISNRLVAVPKPARLSALRAELALIAQDLPAEVDIPLICPATLEGGMASRSRHHRIVRLNPAEATSLNSAERVPYLLMVEVLREDFDFNPDAEQNLNYIARLMAEKGKSKRRLFDITDEAREKVRYAEAQAESDIPPEPATGDLASAALLRHSEESDKPLALARAQTTMMNSVKDLPQLSSGIGSQSLTSLVPPRSSDLSTSRSASPDPRRSTPHQGRYQATDHTDFSALATHMRTASQMLAQLDLSSSKRPRNEVAAIKAKIIASMQSLEEQSFLTEDATQVSNFDTLMANANDVSDHADPADLDDPALEPNEADPNLSSNAGAARMENDIKTGGVQRKGDRDDPSAATFGEAWELKKERIRRSSPYGWMKNWDLLSVIVKTGADLRQEAFACQLIAVCAKIWDEARIDVWVKQMRILVTGESSGLIETITNGVSLHSLKRSLTLASIAAGTNPKKRIATLRDHFIKTFGAPESRAYATAVGHFAKSLAAYSVISYVLQLKDRHNGNILIDSVGHIIHIDFGFMLSNTPGSMGFEAAPFKLTQEYVDVLGGVESPPFRVFREAMKEAFQALRRDAERIVTLVELMGKESRMPCYSGGVVSVVAALRSRFVLEKSKEEAALWVEELIAKSVGSYYTRLYDTFQYRTQGIY
ncbi:hypothetical protein AAFC00_004024 [Neodothiora populina]|uniref:1-phosphatidylinositol 4-kinase n=1 Tax=Neodothiora populina TaxID=2781224 RepID=A0ABR3PID0_9PEZI